MCKNRRLLCISQFRASGPFRHGDPEVCVEHPLTALPSYPLVTFMDYDLGYFDDETCRLEPIENPFGPKVLSVSVRQATDPSVPKRSGSSPPLAT